MPEQALAGLPRPQRHALDVALLRAEPRPEPPDQRAVAVAFLGVIRALAEAAPVIVAVDDLPWLDRASAGVLGFVARRLAGSPVGFLAASRPGQDSFFQRGGLPQLELRPLDELAANGLVSSRFPELAPQVRHRVVAEAQGNPLAGTLTQRASWRRAVAPPMAPTAMASRTRGSARPVRRRLTWGGASSALRSSPRRGSSG